MTLFSILLYVLRPQESVWRRRKLTGADRLQVSMYRWLLKRGLKAYRNFAVSDVVSCAGGRMKIIHEYRDLEFEGMLRTAKVATPLSYKAALCPFESNVGRGKHGWKWFNFTDTLIVEIDGQKVNVEHGELYKVYSSAKVSAKRTGLDDGIDATFLSVAVSLAKSSAKQSSKSSAPGKTRTPSPSSAGVPQVPSEKPKGPVGARKPSGNKGLMGVDGRGMFGKNPQPTLNLPQAAEPSVDPIPEETPKVPEIVPQEPPKEPRVLISKKGLDIDTSF